MDSAAQCRRSAFQNCWRGHPGNRGNRSRAFGNFELRFRGGVARQLSTVTDCGLTRGAGRQTIDPTANCPCLLLTAAGRRILPASVLYPWGLGQLSSLSAMTAGRIGRAQDVVSRLQALARYGGVGSPKQQALLSSSAQIVTDGRHISRWVDEDLGIL